MLKKKHYILFLSFILCAFLPLTQNKAQNICSYRVNTNLHIYQIEGYAAKIDLSLNPLTYPDTMKINIVQHDPDGEELLVKSWIIYQKEEINEFNKSTQILVFEDIGGSLKAYDSWRAYQSGLNGKQLIRWEKKSFSVELNMTGYFTADLYLLKNNSSYKIADNWFRIIRNSNGTEKKPLLVSSQYLYMIGDSVKVHYAYSDMPKNAIIRVYKYNKDGNVKYYKRVAKGNNSFELYKTNVSGSGDGTFTFYQAGNFEIRAYFYSDDPKTVVAGERFYIMENHLAGHDIPYISTCKYVNTITDEDNRIRVIYKGFSENPLATVQMQKSKGNGDSKTLAHQLLGGKGKTYFNLHGPGIYELKVYFEQDKKYIRTGCRFYVEPIPGTHTPKPREDKNEIPNYTEAIPIIEPDFPTYCLNDVIRMNYHSLPPGNKTIELFSGPDRVQLKSIIEKNGSIRYLNLKEGVYKMNIVDYKGNHITHKEFKVFDCNNAPEKIIETNPNLKPEIPAFDCPMVHDNQIPAQSFAKEFMHYFYNDHICYLQAGMGFEAYNKLSDKEKEQSLQMVKLLTHKVNTKWGGLDEIIKVKTLESSKNKYVFEIIIRYKNGNTEKFDEISVERYGNYWRGSMNIKAF
ncbi:MAG: hypothetical protein K9G47_02510 [Bacteroidales bacterium]|nr:hypothetical protein [Bacteroidales bacterium]